MFVVGRCEVSIISATGNPQLVGTKKKEVCLNSDSSYALKIENFESRAVCAEVMIDDLPMGDFILKPRQSIEIERPAHEGRKFHFLAVASDAAKECGATPGKSTNGVISIKFVFARRGPFGSLGRARSRSRERDDRCERESASYPRFGTAASIAQEKYRDGSSGSRICGSVGGGGGGGSSFGGGFGASRPVASEPPPPYGYSAPSQTEEGVTVFGDKSDQQFSTASFDDDQNCYMVVTFKLVARVKQALAPLTGIHS